MAELHYVLTFKGAASPTVQCAFARCDVDTSSGVTVVRCPHSDLSNVIAQIQDLGLELLEVHLVAGRSSGS
jgi:hypothetical protein